MTRTMYDTTNVPATVIPADAEMVAGYVNGNYRSFPAVVQRCPNAVHVSIAVTSHVDADVLDIEKGDATPADAPGWCDRQYARGVTRPSLYCERSQWGAVQAAVGRRNVAYWVADYTYSPHNLLGAAAVQYTNHGPHGENYDMTLVVDDQWPHYDHPRPTQFWTSEEEPMSYPQPVPADGEAHSIPVAPPHSGACQGGYGRVWLSFSWDNLDTPIEATLKARVLAVAFDGSLTPLNPTDAHVDWTTQVPKTRWWVELPDHTASVTATVVEVPSAIPEAKRRSIQMVPMVEAEVKGVPAA